MKRFNAVVLMWGLLSLLVGCADDSDLASSIGPDTLQGLAGMVEFWEGDFMPIVDPDEPRGTITPVARVIKVFEQTTLDDVVADPSGHPCFFTDINTPLVATVESGDDGAYRLGLAPGTYSVFVLEGGRYYANLFTDKGIQPVTVEESRMTIYDIDITYLATY